MTQPMTIRGHLREHALRYASVAGRPGQHPAPPDGYPWTAAWWEDFLRRQAARFVLGPLRYGEVEPGRARQYDWLERLEREAERYRATGDPEALVEIANAAAGEYADRGFHLVQWDAARDDQGHTLERR